MREGEPIYNLRSTRCSIENKEDLDDALETTVKEIILQIEKLEGTRSNLGFKAIISITIHFERYDPTRAGKYIELPKFIQRKKPA